MHPLPFEIAAVTVVVAIIFGLTQQIADMPVVMRKVFDREVDAALRGLRIQVHDDQIKLIPGAFAIERRRNVARCGCPASCWAATER